MSGKPPQTWAEISEAAKRAVPDGTWIHCPACNASLFHRALAANLWVCPECGHHFRLDAVRRIETLVDPDSFEPMDEDLQAVDPLSFVDLKAYPDRINQARAKTGQRDAVRTGHAYIHGRRVVLAAMDFSFLGGSMGSVVGEKIARACEAAEAGDLPFIIVKALLAVPE